MAYAVAKELGMRPLDVLEWSPEELCVAFGVYANQHANEAYEMAMARTVKTQKKEAPPKWLDRWAVLFMTDEQVEQLMKDQEDALKKAEQYKLDEDSMMNAASVLFGG